MPDVGSTLAIVGAGAVSNAWQPVIAALKREGFTDIVTADAANFALARLVYVARIAQFDGDSTDIGKARSHVREKLLSVKRSISEALHHAEAHAELQVRPEFENVMRTFALRQGTRVAVVTTNWDGTVERASRQVWNDVPFYYLHGSAQKPECLYLPTEVVEEPYRLPGESDELKTVRGSLSRAIDQATRLVLYGIGISALDAELGQILASGLYDSSVREIIVVNPRYVDVAERVATLLRDGEQSAHASIMCYAPSELTRPWVFSTDTLIEQREQIGFP